MDEPGTHPGNFVRGNGRTHTAATQRHSAFNLLGGDGSGHRDDEIRVVISGVQLMCAEVHDLVPRATELLRYLFFQGKASMVRCDSYAHHSFALACSITS